MLTNMADAAKELKFEYPDEAMKTWEALWGKDFISPGGAEEVRRIIGDIDLKGKTILEIGSGWGGPALLFAQEYGAAKVVGIDLQAKVVEKATSRAKELGLEGCVEFKTVSSLQWPFADESFDVVFSKDALLHTEDKTTLYTEMRRVLKPGGQIIYADWFGSDLEPSAEMKKWLKDNEFTMVLKSLGFTVDLFVRLGFTDVRAEDRCQHFKRIFEEDVAKLEGEVGNRVSEDIKAECLRELQAKWFVPCTVLAEQGQLRLGRLYTTKPVC